MNNHTCGGSEEPCPHYIELEEYREALAHLHELNKVLMENNEGLKARIKQLLGMD